jgi:hypothetical protein
MQRPIIEHGDRAVIGRPTEKIREILWATSPRNDFKSSSPMRQNCEQQRTLEF